MSLGLATEIASQGLALGESVEDSLLNAVGVLVEAHVTQHHDRAEEKGSGVGQALALNVGGGAVDGLEDGALITDVARGSKTETADEASAHVGQNITVQVGHDQDLVVVGVGVGDHLEAGVVEELGVKLNVGEVLSDLLSDVEEETVRHLHNGGLVHDADLLAANGLGVLESEAQDALAGFAGDELNALDDTVNDDVLDTRVLALGVLADEDSVDTVVGGLETGDRAARAQVGEEVEGTTKSQVEGDVALADGGLESVRTCLFACGFVGCRHTARGPLRAILFFLMLVMASSGMAVLPSFRMGVTSIDSQVMGVLGRMLAGTRANLESLLRETNLGGGEDVLDGDSNLGADTVTFNQADEIVALLPPLSASESRLSLV